MRNIGEALLTPDQRTRSTSNPSTPLKMKYNPLSVYASKPKLAPGKFSEILTPLSDPLLDEVSDVDEENTGKKEQYEQLHYVASRFLSVPKTPISRKQPNKIRTRDLHSKLHNHASTLKTMCACPEYRKNGLKCEPTDIDPLFCCDVCHKALGMIRRPHLRIDKDKDLPGQYYSGDCTGPNEALNR